VSPASAGPSADGAWWLTWRLPDPEPAAPALSGASAVPGPDEEALRRIGLWPPLESADAATTEALTAAAAAQEPVVEVAPAVTVPGVDVVREVAIEPATPGLTSDPAPTAENVPPIGPSEPSLTRSLPPVPPSRAAAQPGTAPRPERQSRPWARAVRHSVDGVARASAAAADVARPRIQHAAARTVDLVLDVVRPTAPAPFVGGRDVAGASAQSEFEWRRARHRRKMRAALPAVVGITLIGMAMGFALFAGRGLLLAGFGSVAVGALGLWAIARLPGDALAWGRMAADQRRTGEYLDELHAAGYVILHDRLAPGLRTNIDHVAIGPAGVLVIETKNLRGKLTMAGDKLFVGERSRTGVIDETYQQALAVQLALSDRLNALRSTVRPVLCVHRTMQLLLDNEVQGVRVVSGPQLARFVRRLPVLLDTDTVQELAALADSRLLPAIP
jgi:hypothetical protein